MAKVPLRFDIGSAVEETGKKANKLISTLDSLDSPTRTELKEVNNEIMEFFRLSNAIAQVDSLTARQSSALDGAVARLERGMAKTSRGIGVPISVPKTKGDRYGIKILSAALAENAPKSQGALTDLNAKQVQALKEHRNEERRIKTETNQAAISWLDSTQKQIHDASEHWEKELKKERFDDLASIVHTQCRLIDKALEEIGIELVQYSIPILSAEAANNLTLAAIRAAGAPVNETLKMLDGSEEIKDILERAKAAEGHYGVSGTTGSTPMGRMLTSVTKVLESDLKTLEYIHDFIEESTLRYMKTHSIMELPESVRALADAPA